MTDPGFGRGWGGGGGGAMAGVALYIISDYRWGRVVSGAAPPPPAQLGGMGERCKLPKALACCQPEMLTRPQQGGLCVCWPVGLLSRLDLSQDGYVSVGLLASVG